MNRYLLFFFLLCQVWAFETFSPEKEQELLATVPEKDRSQLIEALKDAGGNWSELAGAIKVLTGEKRDAAVWLILNMPHLDRLEIMGAVLVEHVEYAFKAQTAFKYEIPKAYFMDYILTYRISDEPVEGWRKPLFLQFAPMVKNAKIPADAARIINTWISRTIKTRASEFFGPLQSPLLTLTCRQGTDEEIAILTTAILKSLGIPGRRLMVEWLGEEDGGASWVEVLTKETWCPLYPLDSKIFGNLKKYESEYPHNITAVTTQTAFEQKLVTKEYTETGIFELNFLENGKPKPGFEHFSVNVFNGGGYRALDDVGGAADSTGNYKVELGEGSYEIIVGVRDTTGNPYVTAQEVMLSPGDTVHLSFEISVPAYPPLKEQ